MKILESIKRFFNRYFFYDKWTCNACGKEIFNDEYFCDDCLNNLPLIKGAKCEHCGRKTIQDETYCLSCKERLIAVDKARSSFSYEKPINLSIQKYKYNGKKYLADLFTYYLFITATENLMTADYIVYVPMTEKSLKKRGFNHGKLLAEKLSIKMGIPVIDVIEKTKETPRQAKLSRDERLENLKGCFRLTKRKSIKGKSVLIVDDVITTGATSETIANILKRAGAKAVYLLTVASVPSKK
ncbi:MAG: ComF family protein [Firmicutes bacterium]|nr:ComF family protein [Candidatus Caballimonas caccae]